jgi:hypothetical protein
LGRSSYAGGYDFFRNVFQGALGGHFFI